MDIHKPKPWHGLREFLKEYVIIVVGVLTALAAEQGVEWMHWREKAKSAEERIGLELALDRAFVEERLAVTGCLDARLVEIEKRLLGSSGAWTPLPPMVAETFGQRVFYKPDRVWAVGVWASVVSDGTVNHLDEQRQLLLGGTYKQIDQLAAMNHEESASEGEINILGQPLKLDERQRLELARLIEGERWRVARIASSARQVKARIDRVGAPQWANTANFRKASNTFNACTLLGLPIDASWGKNGPPNKPF